MIAADVVTIMLTNHFSRNRPVRVSLTRAMHVSQFSCEIPQAAKIQQFPERLTVFFSPINRYEGLHF